MDMNNYGVWLADVELDSPELTDSEVKHLAKLTQAKFPVLPGFVITSQAYFDFLRENELDYRIKQLLATAAIDRADSLMQVVHHGKKLFEQASLSEELEEELLYFYEQLRGDEIILSLHEKSPQKRKHATMHAKNEDEFLEQVKNAWAEMFAGNALWHKHNHHLDYINTGAEIIVQQKIHSNKNGLVVTIDPETHEKSKLVIIVNEPHEKDTYVLSKKNLSIIDRELNHTVKLPKLTEDEILEIAQVARELEDFLYFPQEISWIIENNKLYITHTKPFTSIVQHKEQPRKKIPTARGKGINAVIGTGTVAIIHSQEDMKKIKAHNVIIVSTIEARHMQNVKKVRGVIAEKQLAPQINIFLGQQGIPAVVNVKHAGKKFKNGYTVTINGEKGEIYLGGFH